MQSTHGPLFKASLFAAMVLLLWGVAVLDYFSGEISPWILYIVPISIGTVAAGARMGIVFSVLATALLTIIGYLKGNPFHTEVAFYVRHLSPLVAYLWIVFLVTICRGLIFDYFDAEELRDES